MLTRRNATAGQPSIRWDYSIRGIDREVFLYALGAGGALSDSTLKAVYALERTLLTIELLKLEAPARETFAQITLIAKQIRLVRQRRAHYVELEKAWMDFFRSYRTECVAKNQDPSARVASWNKILGLISLSPEQTAEFAAKVSTILDSHRQDVKQGFSVEAAAAVATLKQVRAAIQEHCGW